MEDRDRQKPLTLDEIEAEAKPKKKRRGPVPYPIGVGDTGMEMGKKSYREDDMENVPAGATIGARIK